MAPIDDSVRNHPNGPICPPSAPKPLEVLKGIEDIQESTNKWSGVTVDDLIIGYVRFLLLVRSFTMTNVCQL